VPFGDIVFEPDSAAGNSGPQGFAKIEGGAYATGADQGVIGGPHIVRIRGYPKLPTPINPTVLTLFENYEVREEPGQQNDTRNFAVPGMARKPDTKSNAKRNEGDH
jgi:hypothetical protein